MGQQLQLEEVPKLDLEPLDLEEIPNNTGPSIEEKRRIRTMYDADLKSGNKTDVLVDPYKGPTTFLGGFTKHIQDALSGNEMLKSAAHPVSTGDMLGLLLPEVQGIGKAIKGLFGSSKVAEIPKLVEPELVLPKKEPKLLNPGPGYIAGKAGVAKNQPHIIDIGPTAKDTGELGTVLPQEMGEVVSVPPDLVAREGMSVGNGQAITARPLNKPLKLNEFLNLSAQPENAARNLTEEAELLSRPALDIRTASGATDDLANLKLDLEDTLSERIPNLSKISDIKSEISDVVNNRGKVFYEAHDLTPNEIYKREGSLVDPLGVKDPELAKYNKGLSSREYNTGRSDLPYQQESAVKSPRQVSKIVEVPAEEILKETGPAPKSNSNITPVEVQSTSIWDNPPKFGRLIDPEAPVMGAVPRTAQSTLPRPSRAINPTNPVDVLWRKLTEAKKLNKEQKILLRRERAERFSNAENVSGTGFDYLNRAKGKLAGEYTKIDFEPLALDQPTIESLGQLITETPGFTITDRIRAGDALKKVINGQLPQNNEIKLLNEMFSPHIPGRRAKGVLNKFVDEPFSAMLNSFKPRSTRAAESFNQTARTISTSFDMSGFRQGLPLAYRKEFWTSIDDMARSGASQKFFDHTLDVIRSDADFKLLHRNGLALGESGRYPTSPSTMAHLLGKMPGIKQSQRAFDGFILKLRFDTAKNMLAKMRKLGVDDEFAASSISNYINTSTGYGDPSKLGKFGQILEATAFSPKFASSRWQMMGNTINPRYYVDLPPGMRSEVLKRTATVLGIMAGANGLAYMAGKKPEFDARSSDFGKIKLDDKTRVDPGNGFLQNAVLMYRMFKNQTKSSASGKVRDFNGKFGAPSDYQMVLNYLENKLAPALGLTVAQLKAFDFQGKPIDTSEEVARRFIPFFIQDVKELLSKDPDEMKFTQPNTWNLEMPSGSDALAGGLSFTGLAGSQVY